MFVSNNERWQAVQSRCPTAASAFVYAVLTTQIFCRPTCPARLARRANVRFYDSASVALDAGFRPCKRCKPEQVLGDSVATEAVKRARRCIENRAGNITLAEVAKEVGLSARYLHGLFKNITGITPSAYASRCRENLDHHASHVQSESSWNHTNTRSGHGGFSSSTFQGEKIRGQAKPGTLFDRSIELEGQEKDLAVYADLTLDLTSPLELLDVPPRCIEPSTGALLDNIPVLDPVFAESTLGGSENDWLGKPSQPGSCLSNCSLPSHSSRNSPYPGVQQANLFCEDQMFLDIAFASHDMAWDAPSGATTTTTPVMTPSLMDHFMMSTPGVQRSTPPQNGDINNYSCVADGYVFPGEVAGSL